MLSYMIIDGQWGSTGKGLIAGYLAMKRRPDAAVCNFGPNAGHTIITTTGDKVMTQMLPSAIISPSVKRVFIGPGAIIDAGILRTEIAKFCNYVVDKVIFIHPCAVVVNHNHKKQEAECLNRISSTCKGTGAAQADKIMRTEGILARDVIGWPLPVIVPKDPEQYTDMILKSKLLQIESAQGMELGINSGGWYPYCTSRDINVWQVLSDCGIPYGSLFGLEHMDVIVSMRTYPIRVGDAFDPCGNKIGTSGPVYPDQTEYQWSNLNQAEETTTVTGKVRRVFSWSDSNFRKMIKILRPTAVFLNFVNYYEDNPNFGKGITGAKIGKMERFYQRTISNIKGYVHMPLIKWIGTGPAIQDVKERPKYEEL